MKQVVYLGSKPVGYRCLNHLLTHGSEIGTEVVAILTNDNRRFGEGSSLPALALEHDIPILADTDELLELPDVDFLISVQYHDILKPEHIQKARDLAINLHMAPLPEYRGCNQFTFAILNSENTFGTTIHRMDEGIDCGPIIFENRFVIPDNCLVKELYDIMEEHSVDLFQASIGKIVRGDYTLTSQDSLVGERGSSLHYRFEIDALKKIDPDWNGDQIFDHVRATYMPGYPPPFMERDGIRIRLIPERNEKRKS